jgi:two-component system, NarL family, response regulator LiaR
MDRLEAEGTERPWRAVVADDDALARRTVNDVLRRAGMVVVAEAANGLEAVELVRYHEPDLALIDIVMPGLDGIAVTRRIIEARPHQLVILLTSADQDDIAMLGLRVGAAGYLRKDVDLDALPRALVGALHGEAAVSRTLAMRVIEELRHVPGPGERSGPVASVLTRREWEVLDLIGESMTTDEIADALFVSAETVRSHVKSILRKLGVRSRREAVAAARGLPRAGY